MSQPTEFEHVRRHVERFGRRATLVSVTEANTPHVVTAEVEIGDGQLLADVGRRTRDNLSARPALCLVWEPVTEVAGGEYQLIVDGTAHPIGDPNEAGVGTVSISVTHGIMHRVAGLPAGPPTCRPLSEA